MAFNQPPPQSQSGRPIAFVLDDQTDGAAASDPEIVDLVIRPEDLNKSEPSRLTAQQTLGGAWADNFGAGIASINISGHTGWRRSSDGRDGIEAFKRLNKIVFKDWHKRRERAIVRGVDPAKVHLIFADSLNGFVWEVAPVNFSLKRNRARPLLLQYNISMVVLSQNITLNQSLLPDRQPPDDVTQAGLDSLDATIEELQAASNVIADVVGGTLGVLSKKFLDLTAGALQKARTLVDGVNGAVDTSVGAFLAVASNLAQAGRNIHLSVTALSQMPERNLYQIMQVQSAFHNAFCLIRNAFKVRRFLPDYTGLYGASTCSSTNGGSPLSAYRNANPFEALVPINTDSTTHITMTGQAQSSLQSMLSVDPVLAPPSRARMERDLDAIVSGTVVL